MACGFSASPDEVGKADKVMSGRREVRMMERSAYSTGDVSGSKERSHQVGKKLRIDRVADRRVNMWY